MINITEMLNKKAGILLLYLLILLCTLSAESNIKEPVYFIDDDIDYFSNVIYKDNQIFALGHGLLGQYLYSFDQGLQVKSKNKISNNGLVSSIMSYKEGFLIVSTASKTFEILYISKKGKKINSLVVQGFFEDCCIKDDGILLLIRRDIKEENQFSLARINNDFKLEYENQFTELSDHRCSGNIKLLVTDNYNYLINSQFSNACIYIYTKEWEFLDQKILTEYDGNCDYKLEIWNDQIVLYPEQAAWINKPESYSDYKGKAYKDQIKYFDKSGTLLRSVDIPRYYGFSFKPVLEKDMYIEQSEKLKTIYLVSSMGDKVREMDFDFDFVVKDHTLLPDDKFLFAGLYAINQYWEYRGLLLLSDSPDEVLSLFPMTEDALILETAFETNDREMLRELMKKWYYSGLRPKKLIPRKWEREAYALYYDILPTIYEENKTKYFTQERSVFDPVYQMIPSHLTVEISDSINTEYHPRKSILLGTHWNYEPNVLMYEINDFRPDIKINPIGRKFIYSTEDISNSLLGYLSLSKEDKLYYKREQFLKRYLIFNIREFAKYRRTPYNKLDFATIIFDSNYRNAYVIYGRNSGFFCIKKSGVWVKSSNNTHKILRL